MVRDTAIGKFVNSFYIPIVPLPDGNGRLGRLWHTLILAKWKEFFLWIPIETLIHERQENYYQALNAANTAGESTLFVGFMLGIIHDVLTELSENKGKQKEETIRDKLIMLLRKNGRLSAKSLSLDLGISERQVQRILKELKASGMIERAGANRNGTWIVH